MLSPRVGKGEQGRGVGGEGVCEFDACSLSLQRLPSIFAASQ